METLTMVDRGDCCSAQARILVSKGDLRLMFCSHHFSYYSLQLMQQGWQIVIDDREQLLARTGVEVS
jgi:hypothetical protein